MQENESLAVTWRPIGEIRPYPGNPRTITKSAIDKVALSIQEFGWRQPIVVDEASEIIVGHTRYAAAKKLKLKTVPVHAVIGMAPAAIRAYRLADNRTHEEAQWDLPALQLELKALDLAGFDLKLTAFEPAQLSDFGLLSPVPVEDVSEELPKIPANPVVRSGDLWILGEHRLLCGDSRNAADVKRLLGRRQINVAFTSPPYAEQRDYDASSGFKPIPPDDYVAWFKPIAANVASHLAHDGSWFVNIKPSVEGLDTSLYVIDLVIAHVRDWGWHFATEFCWERVGVPKRVQLRFKNQFEPIYQFARNRWKIRPAAVRHHSDDVPRAAGKGVGDTNWKKSQGGNGPMFGAGKRRLRGTSAPMDRKQGSNSSCGELVGPGMAYPGNRLPTFSHTHEATGHAAAFPVGLPDFFIRAYSDEGDVVFDPFGGSGSTLIAAHNTNRLGRLIEISPAYCEAILMRWEAITGKNATREDGRTLHGLKAKRGKI